MGVRAHTQILVRNLEGNTVCLPHDGYLLCGADLKVKLAGVSHVPAHCQRLVSGTIDIHDDTVLIAAEHGTFPSCTLLLRLLGGKGGFGSLLRGATSKAGQKKTSNFDACRDMSGRRLRHVNAEKQLKEWTAGQQERELEKAGEEFIKKLAKEKKESESIMADVTRIREENAQAIERVSAAVESGLKEARKQVIAQGKRKVAAEEVAPHKRSKLLSMLQEVDEESDEEDGEHNAVQGEAEVLVLSPSQSAEAGPSSSSDNQQQPPAEPISDSDDNGQNTIKTPDTGSESEVGVADEDQPEVARLAPEPAGFAVVKNAACHGSGDAAGDKVQEGPLQWDRIHHSKELEALGLDRLKSELQERGLKCGGSVSERAARLFLLKSIPLEKLDRKHFAKVYKNGQ